MIAIVNPQFYGVHGIARYIDSFLNNLPEGYPTVYLITGDENREERSYPGVEIIHLSYSSGRLSLFTWGWQARKLIIRMYAEGKIRWVNLHFPPLIPGLLLPRHVPVVLTAHTTYLGMSGRFYPTRHFESQWGHASLAVKSWMEHRIFDLTSEVITLTEQGRQEVLAYGFRGPVTVIPNGADVSLFTPDDAIEKDIDVLFCGRIEFRKGSRAMAELCRRLVALKPDIQICIVGYGDDESWVKEAMAPYARNVRMTGKVSFSETQRYYNRSRVYASTSYYEGLPGTCLEAMAMGVPPVVWDFLFYRGLVNEGETGLLAAPNDFNAMPAKVLELLASPQRAEELGRNGRVLLEREYNWKKLAREVLDVFKP
ncbi:Glycosyltransferase involved in cell wall bisynthesis [Nitrosospira briensis]|uniref:Glycosyltransferase involved in cell wall bisynthesis n=1 Tax=Nitrosospira briensis TaxID=35799 RepID=A0A1I5D811_9PROT|nr:glycosyltransferase family 4 protein [Nitrosospira briensis]SFN95339.1 Glycosyltransferase involved in cell wall bisynthesis [Nitrosospira briensis]